MTAKYLILGAGPAGLSFAAALLKKGETSFVIVEKETVPGGLCRSTIVDDSPLDIGGGHFLDVRRPKVNEFLFQFMPLDEWNLYKRDSRITIHNNIISHPIEANIWQMDLNDQVKYLKSIAAAGCNTGKPMPGRFVDWIHWKFGECIAQDYMIPYNQKIFGENLDDLGIYWLDKLPNVSLEETMLSCLTQKAYGNQPGHAQFYYPKKYGYGELWLRMAEKVKDHIAYNTAVIGLNFSTRTVTTTDGQKYSAEKVITTIPWTEFSNICGLPDDVKNSISDLKYSSVQTEYYPENMDTQAQWVYYPAPELSYHRILVRHNFCSGSHGYWTETNPIRAEASYKPSIYGYTNKYAYPHNTVKKPEIMGRLLNYAELKSIYGLGRWGEWEHYNSDATVERAMLLADKFLGIGI